MKEDGNKRNELLEAMEEQLGLAGAPKAEVPEERKQAAPEPPKPEVPKAEPPKPEVPKAEPPKPEMPIEPEVPKATAPVQPKPEPPKPEMPEELKQTVPEPLKPEVSEERKQAAPEPPKPEVPKAEPPKPEMPEGLRQAAPEQTKLAVLDQLKQAAPEQPKPEAPELLKQAVPEPPKPEAPAEPVRPEPAAAAVPAHPQPVMRSVRLNKKEAKKHAKEELRELKRQTKADKVQHEMERRQQYLEERETFPTAHLRRKARKLRWKREKAERRQALKDRYKDAPWIIRVPRLYLLKPFIALLIISIVLGGAGLVLQLMMPELLSSWMETSRNTPVSQEEIYAQSPIDEDGAKRINAVAPVSKDDTWTISVYIVGSNLEDMDENDLSAVVQAQISKTRDQIAGEEMAKGQKMLDSFTDELKANDLDMPSYLYYPNKPTKTSGGQEAQSGPVVTEDPGAASTDIDEMTADTWSDNISVVIQTGGATRWSNSRVNPNRTQRFLYKNGHLEEIENLPLQRATDPKTLTSFLKYCKEEYPADHNMLVLWNHGGGAFGYGVDSIYGGMMSNLDIREALEGAYKPDAKNPPLDIIGFDACLMSSLEVVHDLNGFASYYAVSEETEPGDGWDYTPWLTAMTKDPTMSPAKVCQEIADSYMDYYMTQNVNIGWLVTNDVTFSVLDASKTEQLYNAWCDLTKQQLIDAAKDGSVLSEIGRCSNKSTYMVASVYDMYNTIDLGNYVDLMMDTYPKECSRIKKLIGESVMYHRENGSLSDVQGISVYLPGAVNNLAGLTSCMDYVYNICEDPSTRALYYYKVAGCLNDEMKEYLATLTDDKPWTLDLKPFQQFAKTKPQITEDGFDIAISENLQSMLQRYDLELAAIDEDTGSVINYGKDETVQLDGEGKMVCDFDGKWICYDGVPLGTEVVASTVSSVEYRSKVLYNGRESYLTFTYDRDKEEFTINGIRGVSDLSGGIINEDPINYLNNSRMNTEIKKGDIIVPLYHVDQFGEGVKEGDAPSEGEEIKVGSRSKITVDKLPKGTYLTAAVISDQRGDVYYSQVVNNIVSGGSVKTREVDLEHVARDY